MKRLYLSALKMMQYLFNVVCCVLCLLYSLLVGQSELEVTTIWVPTWRMRAWYCSMFKFKFNCRNCKTLLMYYLLFVYNFHYTKLAVCTLNMLVMSFYIKEIFFFIILSPDVPLKLIICSHIPFEKKNQKITSGTKLG